MESLLIKGGVPLHGEVTISGAKNAVLPIMAATLLTGEPCVIRARAESERREVHGANSRLARRGGEIRRRRHSCSRRENQGSGRLRSRPQNARLDLHHGAAAGAVEKSAVSLPGGCVIGARPINLHLKGFEALGAKVKIESGYVHARARRLVGADDVPRRPRRFHRAGHGQRDDGGDAGRRRDVIESAACEPEVVDLANFLNAMGAKISGAGSPTITITGVKELHGAEHEVIPDRIEAATYAIAAAATNGEVTLRGRARDHLHAVIDKLSDAGVSIDRKGTALTVRRNGRLKPVDITTLPYSGFPTDVQAQMMALMTLTPGISIITERIFESRFMHVSELARLGADIEIEGPSAIVKGGKPLSGAPVMASDLRASAALVIAGLAARGTTQVNRVYHLDRGYENMDAKLRQLGARIQRVEET